MVLYKSHHILALKYVFRNPSSRIESGRLLYVIKEVLTTRILTANSENIFLTVEGYVTWEERDGEEYP